MAKNTYKFDVDVSAKSLTKLKKTISGLKVQLDQSSVGELEDAMADLTSELTINTAHLEELTKVLEKMGGGGAGRPSDIMGGGGGIGGSTEILKEIKEILEQNGTRIKSLTDDTSKGLTFEQRMTLKQTNFMQKGYEHQLMMRRKAFQAAFGGEDGGGMGSMLKAGGGMMWEKLTQSMDDLLKFQSNSGEINKEMGGATGGMMSPEQKTKLGAKYGISDIGSAQKNANSKIGGIIGKLDKKMGGKGMQVMGAAGMGAMGAAGIVKKGMQALIESSPMLKQMMKLLNFGIMMVLRPIGDFFGFLFRPILIMLLRKFIIPWYQKMYPQMMKWGTEIGSKLAKAFEALASGDVAGAFKALWGEIDFSKIFWAVFWGKNIDGSDDKPKLPSDEDQVDWGAGVQKWFDDGLEEHSASFDTWSASTGAWFTQGLADSAARWTTLWTTVKSWFSLGLSSATKNWKTIFTTLWFWIHKGLTGEKVSWTTIWTTITGWFTKGLTSVVINWGVLWQKMVHHFSLGMFGSSKGEIVSTDISGAGGLHVTEPIIGIGQRTGKSYLMGEAGNETLIPDSQLGGGGGITINIENFSASQQELNKLRQTILSVVQEANTRRGRI